MQYSESRPDFIRALLEHVGAEINPIRLISRIRNGLEIPGLKSALIKVLQASNLQVSLLEGCQDILSSDCNALAFELQARQTGSVPLSGQCSLPTLNQRDRSLTTSAESNCQVCRQPAFGAESPLALMYLCRHLVHATCALPHADIELPPHPEDATISHLLSDDNRRNARSRERELGSKLSYAAAVRVRVGKCPVCEQRNRETVPVRPGLQPRVQSLVTAQA